MQNPSTFNDEFSKKISRINNQHYVSVYRLYVAHKTKVELCLEDNLEHLTPIVLLFGKNTYELKILLGKGCWKKICKKSFEENQLILSVVLSYKNLMPISEKVEVCKFVCDLHSHTMDFLVQYNLRSAGLDFTMDVIDKWAKNLNDKEELKRRIHIFKDMKRMAVTLRYRLPKKMNWKTIEKTHNELSTAMESVKLNIHTAVFTLASIAQDKIDKNGIADKFGVDIKCLKSVKDYTSEKSTMNHCILSYCKDAYKGKYLSIHIHKDGEHTTLGMNPSYAPTSGAKIGLKKQQHYGKHNKHVESKDIKKAAEEIELCLTGLKWGGSRNK